MVAERLYKAEGQRCSFFGVHLKVPVGPLCLGWRSGMEVPLDISIAYLIQGSFYAHSIYSTMYMDMWRKDSLVMVVHHIITLALITFSYAFRSGFVESQFYLFCLYF